MKKKRIVSSAMAAVMALSSVPAVYAETAASSASFVKTKADLQTYVNSFSAFIENDLESYGTVSSESFTNAVTFANNVLSDSASTGDDYSVAYIMLSSAYANLMIHTTEELQALIDSCEAIYLSDNIYNEGIADLIYDSKTYETFVKAYENALQTLDSAQRVVTDSYLYLKAAIDGLNPLPTVTKTQFRSALKSYEAMLMELPTVYDSWRRGAFGDWVDLYTGNYWAVTSSSTSYIKDNENYALVDELVAG
ncbi:MAG: hypothetical protein ACI4Q4_01660, partial [Oscillospiraceae bacterium]